LDFKQKTKYQINVEVEFVAATATVNQAVWMREILLIIKLQELFLTIQFFMERPLLEKAKLAREISDGKNEIPHKFLDRKI